MVNNFDCIIIGTGPAGTTVTQKLGELGWKVAVVDSNGYGGTCPLRGCVPKKVLSEITEMVGINSRLKGTGLYSQSSINWEELIAYKNTFTRDVSQNRIDKFHSVGVTTLHGFAKFIDEQTIEVNGETYSADKIVIATGATPMQLPIEGHQHLKYSDDFLDMTTLPKHIVFIGGGYISLEFAHIAARSGAEVHVLQRGPEIMEGFDRELVHLLEKESEAIGISIHTNASAKSIEKTEDGYLVTATDQAGKEMTWKTDYCMASTGRVPAIEGMDLEKANIKYTSSGIQVNPFLQSVSNPHVYAGGDVAMTEGVQLTPVAKLDGKTILDNLIRGNERKADYQHIPSVAFTLPRLATVGLSVEEAKKTGKRIKIHELDMSEWFSFKVMQEEHTKAIVILDEKDDVVLGAHILSDQADQLINYFAICCQLQLKVSDLKEIVYTFPSVLHDTTSMF